MSNVGHTRRSFLKVNLAGVALASLFVTAGTAHADPQSDDAEWIANHVETRLLGADGQAMVGLPRWTRMRIVRGLPSGQLQVWVPRYNLVGRVAADAIGPVPSPSPADLQGERLDGPDVLYGGVNQPGRIIGGANLRTWPGAANPPLRTLGHNAPVRVLDSVEGDDGDEWYRANLLDGVTGDAIALGYLHNSLVRLPRMRYTPHGSPDRADDTGRHFEADLREPALLTAFEDGAPIWSTLTLKGTVSKATPSGFHRILWRVPNETMTSERVYPPIPRDAPGGYYLRNVLFTQYFTSDGASIHYNYWSSNWGYAGSHGCLGVAYNEAKFAWDWADVGTPVYVFT
jgi:L,D-transpeptidase catalytic domain